MDIAKFISAFLVICIHVGPLLDINKEANFILVQIVARIAVPLFFIISGFLFFKKIDLHREWNDYENMHTLRHYIGRLTTIYLVWTILYLPFSYLVMRSGGGITLASILGYIRDFFFAGSFYHLWFLPALLFAVSISYFMIMKWGIGKTIWIALLLYVIGMMGNVYPKLWDGIPMLHTIWKGYTDLFVTTRNGLFFGLIFIAFGAYFSMRHIYLKRKVILIGFLISLVGLFIECYLLRENGFMKNLTSMYIMLIPCVCFLFLYLLRVKLEKRKVYKTLRSMSLLIYVSHIMFVSILIWTMPTINSLLAYAITVVASVFVSYLIVVLSRKLSICKILY